MRDASAALAETLDSLRAAASFLTRLPLSPELRPARDFLARASVAFPIVGAAIGAAGGVIYALFAAFALPPLVCAFAALAFGAALTGALHEDGLADFCDGIGGGRDRHDRLRIMRDSHNGSYGTLALVMSVGIRAALLAGIAAAGPVTAALVAAGAVSRGLLPAIMGLMAPARADGLGATAGQPSRPRFVAALGLAFVLAWGAMGFAAALASALFATAGAAAVALVARRLLGGHTGDVLGACQQAAEIAVLTVAAVMAVP
ncbi:MAG: adenosylcobinamide-GDP ribazoletransferase [Rhodospirillales bacterium]|nr:adenosylcobinamide-GDP ribazoletransferase [Rhodospirillales bacterium]